MNKIYRLEHIVDDVYKLVDRRDEKTVMQGSLIHIHAFISLLEKGFAVWIK